MQFKATTKAKTLLDWLRAINAVADECVFDTSGTDAVTVRVVDPANALLLDMRMPDHAWDVLDMEQGRFGVDVSVLIDRVKTFDLDADITISREDGNLVRVADSSAWYTVPIIEPDNLRKAPEIPVLDLPAKVIIDAARLQRMVKRAASVSDHLRIGLEPVNGYMFVSAKGDASGYEEHALFDGEVVVLPGHRVAVSSLYSLDYTEGVAKTTAGDVVIDLGSDLPMLLSFVLHDAIVCYVQAPRVEKD